MVNSKLVDWIRKGRKENYSFPYLSGELLRKGNPKPQVDEAIQFVKDEEKQNKKWLFFLLGFLPLIIIAFTLFFVFSQDQVPDQAYEIREGFGDESGEEIVEPASAPILSPPETTTTPVTPPKKSSGGGGGGGGSSSPEPTPSPTPAPTDNESEVYIVFLSPQETVYDNGSIIISINSTGNETWIFNEIFNETYTGPVSKKFKKGKHVLYAFTKGDNGKSKRVNVSFEVISKKKVNETTPGPKVNDSKEKDLCEGIKCGSYCDGTTLYYSGECSEGMCNYKVEENSEDCGYEEPEKPINITKPTNFGFESVMDSTFIVIDDGTQNTLHLIKNSSGVVDTDNDALYQKITSFAEFKEKGDAALAETELYFLKDNVYQHLMFDEMDLWIKITPQTDKGLLNQLGLHPQLFKDQSGLDEQFNLINNTEFLPVDGDKCNQVFLAKKPSSNGFMNLINRMIIWPISKLKYKFGAGNVIKEKPRKEERCRIKIIADKKVVEGIAEKLFEQIANSSDAMSDFIKYQDYSFSYKKAMKDFDLEYEIDEQSRIVKVIMTSSFDFDKKSLESKDKGKKKGVPFRTKANITITTDFFGYGEQLPITLTEDARNAIEVGELFDSLQ